MMEANTFATSAYVQAPMGDVVEYLARLENLNEWTLFSRMQEQVDDNTWLGTASGYQRPLYYSIRRSDQGGFRGIEWHCGLAYGEYFQVYPVLLFPAAYVDPDAGEAGVYLHWVSFVDPGRRTPMIEQGIGAVHTAECRSLKGILERNAGLTRPARGRYRQRTDAIFVDAPLERGVEFLADVRAYAEWSFPLRARGALEERTGEFTDEYGRSLVVNTRVHPRGEFYLVEREAWYPDPGWTQKTVTIVIPCSYAFAIPDARGFIKHQISFWPRTELEYGKIQLEDYIAESINYKRMLEARVGNLDSFARGFSYQRSE